MLVNCVFKSRIDNSYIFDKFNIQDELIYLSVPFSFVKENKSSIYSVKDKSEYVLHQKTFIHKDVELLVYFDKAIDDEEIKEIYKDVIDYLVTEKIKNPNFKLNNYLSFKEQVSLKEYMDFKREYLL